MDRQAADDFHKVAAFLRDHLGALYCDACLAATTGLDKVRITNTALNLARVSKSISEPSGPVRSARGRRSQSSNTRLDSQQVTNLVT